MCPAVLLWSPEMPCGVLRCPAVFRHTALVLMAFRRSYISYPHFDHVGFACKQTSMVVCVKLIVKLLI